MRVSREIHRQFAAREVEKSYLALVQAPLKPLEGGTMLFEKGSGSWETRLNKKDGRVFAVETPGTGDQLATTRWKLLAKSVSLWHLQ